MSSIKYLLQVKNKSESAPIYLRLLLGRNKDIKRKIGLTINSNDWSTTKGLPKQNNNENKNLTTKLRKLRTYILKEVNDASSQGEKVTGDWLIDKIDVHFKRLKINEFEYLTNYGDRFLEELDFKVSKNNKKGVSISTKKKYNTIVNKLKQYEDKLGKQLLLKEVNLKFQKEFMRYLSEVDKLSDNTVGRYLKVVKTICLDAQRNGFEVSNQLQHFKGFTVKIPIVTLSLDELNVIMNKEFLNVNHQIARDWLIIGCFTGQRVSDLMRMTKSMIHQIRNFEFIVLTQKKTEKLVQIPIHNKVKKILDKRNGEFPPLFNSKIETNNVLFNRYLKQLCEIAEIDEVVEGNKYNDKTNRYESGNFEKHKLVASHICRRSFASNFYAKRKYTTPLLMNITAHSSEKQFLEYIGKKPIDYGLQLAEIWSKEALKGSKEVQLSVVKNKLSN
jgi:integrase